MSAVANRVDVVAAESVEAVGSAAAELGVGDEDTAVDDIAEGALTGAVIVAVGGAWAGAGRDGPETPGSPGLGGDSTSDEVARLGIVQVGNLVLLDVGDLYDGKPCVLIEHFG